MPVCVGTSTMTNRSKSKRHSPPSPSPPEDDKSKMAACDVTHTELSFPDGSALHAWPNRNFLWSPRTPRRIQFVRTPPLSASAMEELERKKLMRHSSSKKSKHKQRPPQQHLQQQQHHHHHQNASSRRHRNNSSSSNNNNNNAKDTTNNTSSSDCDENFDSLEEELLFVSRHGKESRLLGLLMASAAEGEVEEEQGESGRLDVNCKGSQKNNRGWTPLHLAAYFGQASSVRLLLEFGARVNMLNSCGESPLHLASYTGREEVVGLLLQHDADTTIINTRGQRACDVTKNTHIIAMLEAADKSATIRRECDFLEAASSGDTETLARMLQQDRGAYISAIDSYGNTGLHLASVRGHGAAAVFLMQHGIDSTAINNAGQTALDLAQTHKMKQVLAVQPIKSLTLQPQRFEGCLLKKSRFVGFKLMWVVLDRGVLSYFHNRGDASTGAKRRGMKYLDEAKVITSKSHATQLRIEYSDGSKQTLHVEMSNSYNLTLQKWINALQEHIAYSSYYIHKGEAVAESDDDLVSLGTMKDSLQNAQAHKNILDKNVTSLKESISAMSRHIQKAGGGLNAHYNSNGKSNTGGSVSSSSSGGGGGGSGSSKTSPVVTAADLRVVESQASGILASSQEMYLAMSHCLALISQQEELREVQLQEERERCRLLQDSLHALATEHHELEKSISRRPSFVSMEEEFFDCDDDHVYDSPGGDVFADAMSNDLVMADGSRSRQDSASRGSNDSDQFGRTSLPVPMLSRNDFSIWSILKQCIGKELSKITMPVVFNEPLSFIQRLCEYMAYAPVIEKAATCDDPVERMTLIAAFAVSALSSNLDRIGKPFNPLLGETYELDRPDLGFRYMGEQVSHHPPITAFHAQGNHYNFSGSISPKLKFWGKAVEVNPKGVITLELKKYNEVYTWSNVNCCIHNVIVGTLWVEHYGTMEITCNNSNLRAVLNFKQSGWFAKDLHKIEGYVYRGKQKEVAIYGSWVKALYALNAASYDKQMSEVDGKSSKATKQEKRDSLQSCNHDLKGQKCIWQVHPKPPHSKNYYQFSTFSMSLNEMVPGMERRLPPTDSRLRPDIRSMEDGNIDSSAAEKNRVEEKQRDKRKERKKKSAEWSPTWFKSGVHAVSGKEDWTFDPSYWDRQWNKCPDIF